MERGITNKTILSTQEKGENKQKTLYKKYPQNMLSTQNKKRKPTTNILHTLTQKSEKKSHLITEYTLSTQS